MSSRSLALAALLVLAAGCASLAEKDQPKLELDEASADAFRAVAAVPGRGLVDYRFGQANGKAEWLTCHQESPKATVLLFHTDRAGFAPDAFCKGWIAQAFLAQGCDVVTVNRPGYGASTGRPDFGGAPSVAAVKAGIADAVAKAKLPKPVSGAWGYGTGATVAALAAKQLPELKFLLLGGGVYDEEETAKATTDAYLKQDIATIRRTGGDRAMEQRSVAYDPSGLPKRLSLYHGALDTAAPFGQAKAFADALESSGGYQVSFQVLDGLGHDLPWVQHRKIIEALVEPLAAL